MEKEDLFSWGSRGGPLVLVPALAHSLHSVQCLCSCLVLWSVLVFLVIYPAIKAAACVFSHLCSKMQQHDDRNAVISAFYTDVLVASDLPTKQGKYFTW